MNCKSLSCLFKEFHETKTKYAAPENTLDSSKTNSPKFIGLFWDGKLEQT